MYLLWYTCIYMQVGEDSVVYPIILKNIPCSKLAPRIRVIYVHLGICGASAVWLRVEGTFFSVSNFLADSEYANWKTEWGGAACTQSGLHGHSCCCLTRCNRGYKKPAEDLPPFDSRVRYNYVNFISIYEVVGRNFITS